MQTIDFERAYKVSAHDPDGNRVFGPFVAVGVHGRVDRVNDSTLAVRWTMNGNFDALGGTAYSFFGEPVSGDGDIYVFHEVATDNPREFRFELLTWDRTADMDLAKRAELMRFAPKDSDLENFFIQNYLPDDAKDQGDAAASFWVESAPAARLTTLSALLESAKKKVGLPAKKKGFPVGTIHKWSDGHDYEKHPDGTWRRVLGQQHRGLPDDAQHQGPPLDAYPVAIGPEAAKKVLPPGEDGWRGVGAAPWLQASSMLGNFLDAHDPVKMRPKPERKKLHSQIIARAFAGKTPVPKNGPTAPIALVTMGAPASGKSTVAKALIKAQSGDNDDSNFVHCDCDNVKLQLPEYREALQAKVRDAADIVHNESTYVNDRIYDKAVKGNYNIVFDGLGKDIDYYKKDVIEHLKGKGYHVKLVTPFLPDAEMNVARANERGRKEGRFVNEAFIRAVFPIIPKNFRKLMRLTDSYSIYSTVEPRAPSPVFYGSGPTEENDVVLDKDAFQKFMALSEKVAALLMKLLFESKGHGYIKPSKPPAISYEDAEAYWVREVKRTAEVHDQLPEVYTKENAVVWPVGEPTAGTTGRPVDPEDE